MPIPSKDSHCCVLQELRQVNGKTLPKPCEMFQALTCNQDPSLSPLSEVKRPQKLSRGGGDHSGFFLLLAFGQEEPWLKLTDELNNFFSLN